MTSFGQPGDKGKKNIEPKKMEQAMAITLKTPGKIVSSSVMIKANKLRALKGDMTTGAFTNQVFESLQNLNLGKIITTLSNNNSTVRIILVIQKVT